jgi:hypothetical protein
MHEGFPGEGPEIPVFANLGVVDESLAPYPLGKNESLLFIGMKSVFDSA